MSIFNATFSTGQLTKAADVTNAALQTWIRRDLIIGQDGEGVEMPGRPGVRRSFTFRSVMEVAVAAELVRADVDVADAFRAANRFAHRSETGPTDSPDRLVLYRNAGFPFPGPLAHRTLLAVSGEKSTTIHLRPRVDGLRRALEAFGSLDRLTIVDTSSAFERVTRSLDLDPQATLDEAYGRAS